MKPWLTYTEACRVFDKSRRQLQRWVAEGRITTDIDTHGHTMLNTRDLTRIEADKKRHAGPMLG